MDELVHHCLRELSFDGDLGCDVSRLTDFVAGFYAAHVDHPQLVNDAFCAFVWSLIVQQPPVRVGTLPPGLISEVYIAPQTSAKRKAAAKGEEVVEGVPPSLLPVDDARNRSLDDLKREYGDNLRIAVDSETSFAAVTGSHIRPPKLSPMVYSALQLITRGREDGITTVELGRKTGYDQKTCFYLVKQLTELDLVIKARRGGVGNHTCIHKYFVERSPLWQQIQKEALDGEYVTTGNSVGPCDTAEETIDQDGSSQIHFDPIDSRHLSSLPLVKNRLVRLLRASRNHVHRYNNLLTMIGFVHPTKTDRRFFQTRLRELIQQGVIERVLVPSRKIRDRTTKCIRLVTSDNKLPEGSVVVGQDGEDEREQSLVEDNDTLVGQNEVKANLTIHKQVSNILEEAGPSGQTLNEICIALGNFDKRTVELLLTRASSSRPPVHLGDLGTVDVMETYGRERRHRYFTLAAYRCVMADEQLQPTTTSIVDTDLSQVGDLTAPDPKHYYTTKGMLHSYQDSFKDTTTVKVKKRKRDEGASEEESEPLPKRKRGRPRKTTGLADATTATPKKRGRPRKSIPAKEGKAKGRATEGSPLECVTEVRDASNGQAVENTFPTSGHEAGLHAEDALLTASSRDVQDQQPVLRPSTGSYTLKNGTQTSTEIPRVVYPAEHPIVTQAGLPSERIDFYQAFGERVDHMRPRYLTRTTGSSSKQRGINTPNVDYHSTPKPTDNGVGTGALESLDKRDLGSKPPTSISQEEQCTITVIPSLSDSIQTVGQEQSPIPGHDVSTSEKPRFGSAFPTQSSRPSKRSRSNEGWKLRPNINISSLRRENELFKVVENMGGIASMHSKGIFEAHTALLDSMSQAKEPTSAPAGTRLDKRTAESTLKSMENRGRIKMLKTSLIMPSGISKPTCLVYIPNTPQEKINAFLCQLGQSVPSMTTGPVKVLEEPIEYGLGVSNRKTEEARSTTPLVPNPPAKEPNNRQGSPIQSVSTKKRGKLKEENEASKRSRFHWAREFDELARDAFAVIRGRCRTSRLDLTALDQVFPAVPKNSVRQRIVHLRENPAEDLYMKRLEDKWYTVWVQYRGTPYLPDEDPSNPSNFNLTKHIGFLRNHVDKNALRMGFMECETQTNLVASVQELYNSYEVIEDVISAPAWDFMWGTTVEEGREKQLRSQAFTNEPDGMYECTRDEKIQLGEAALKMVFGIPNEFYDSDVAARLLHSVGSQCISVAKSNLLHHGVLSKVMRDPKKLKPGRMLKISDTNLNSMGGPFPRDMFQDAILLEDMVVERMTDGMEWPIITSEGDTATLLQLVSEDHVGFTVDLSQSQVARQKVDWNSKRADDEDIETSIRLRFHRTFEVADACGDRNQFNESPGIEIDHSIVGQETHGTTLDGKDAACTLKTETGLINCSACVDAAFIMFTSSLPQSNRDLARRIVDNVRSRKESGLNKAACLCLGAEPEQHTLWLIHKMTLTSPPILFWKYFNAPVLVAGDYCGALSVVVSDEPMMLIAPRRWLDLRGYRLDSAWRVAQQAVTSFIFLHPGISQAELQWRLRAVYDRQEVVDLLSSLLEDGVLECRTEVNVGSIQTLPGWLKALDNGEVVLWFIAKNHRWYQV